MNTALQDALGGLLGALRGALLDAWSVLCPVSCAGCGADDRALCPACRGALAFHPVHHELADGTPVFSALRYSGPARTAILAFKEQGRTDVARALARPLRQVLHAALAGRPVPLAPVRLTTVRLTTVPSTRRGLPASRLRPGGTARAHGRRASGAAAAPRPRPRGAEVARPRGRSRNLVGSLAARHPSPGTVVIVDDIMTTGATLTEAVRAIRAAGGQVEAAVTLAYTRTDCAAP